MTTCPAPTQIDVKYLRDKSVMNVVFSMRSRTKNVEKAQKSVELEIHKWNVLRCARVCVYVEMEIDTKQTQPSIVIGGA